MAKLKLIRKSAGLDVQYDGGGVTVNGQNIGLLSFPIGALYISVNSTSPASLFGGTWEQLKDRFLLGAGDTYTNGNTGGDATHTHTLTGAWAYVGRRNYSPTTLWVKSSRDVPINASVQEYGTNTGADGNTGSWDIKAADLGGSTDSGSSLPPYLVVYMWKRIS